jgi:5-methylthioribose kinase
MKISDLSSIEMKKYIESLGLSLGEVSNIEIAGLGNMNCTLRVTHNEGSLIIKQSQPYCEKYPTIAAPVERANIEALFYKYVSETESVSSFFPKLLANDTVENILIIEDLGPSSDYSFVYNNEFLSGDELKEITRSLLKLHSSITSDGKELDNKNMKILNHEYIFIQPLRDLDNPSLDEVTVRLNEESKFLRSNEKYKKRVSELGEIYLSDGKRLLHGDYYTNSWLKSDKGIFVIDPEFGFFGRVEFDFGVLLAHMVLSNQPKENIQILFDEYHPNFHYDETLALSFAGVEIMRRLLGVAQLPLKSTLEDKVNLLYLSKRLVLHPSKSLFEL